MTPSPGATRAARTSDNHAGDATHNRSERGMRDRIMARLHGHYPSYGFETNVGYSTAAHLAALGTNGPCPFHRQSFAPVRQGVLDL